MSAFVEHSAMTDPGVHADWCTSSRKSVAAVVQTVRGLLIHDAFIACYDLAPESFSQFSRETLPIEVRLGRILGASKSPLQVERRPNERQIGTCRDFALMTCSLLRSEGIAARVRCGFATYFPPNKYEDHWICEMWNNEETRWLRIDAQLDGVQQQHFKVTFDTLDVPRDSFQTAAEIWKHVQSGEIDTSDIGHGSANGEWFLYVNIVRDRLALNDVVVSTWDMWRDALADRPGCPTLKMQPYERLATEVLAKQDLPEAFGVPQAPEPFWMAKP